MSHSQIRRKYFKHLTKKVIWNKFDIVCTSLYVLHFERNSLIFLSSILKEDLSKASGVERVVGVCHTAFHGVVEHSGKRTGDGGQHLFL